MLDKDVKYYKAWSVGDWLYRLVFIPGKDTEITTEYIELPANFILNDVKVKAGYDSEIPIGLPLADEMDLTWDLANMYDDSYATWSEFRQWLIDGSTIKGSTYFNAVILQSNNGSGENYDTIEFIGVQDVKPQKEIDVTQESMTFKCSYVSLNRVIFERLKWKDILPGKTSFDYKCSGFANYQRWKYPAIIEMQYLAQIHYVDSQGQNVTYRKENPPGSGLYDQVEVTTTNTMTTGWKGEEDTALYFHKFSNVLNAVYYAAQVNLRKFTRRSDNYVLNLNSPITHLTLNSSKVDTLMTSKAHLTDDDIYILTGVYRTTALERSAGYYDSNDKNQTIYKYKTPWDWIKALGQLGSKITFSYSTGLNCQIEYTKILNNPAVLSKSVTKQNSVLPLKIGEGSNLKQTAELSLIGKTGEFDVDSYIVNDGGAENDNSYSEELCLHNNIINYTWDSSDGADEFVENPSSSVLKRLPTFTNFYHIESAVVTPDGGTTAMPKKVSDVMTIDLGNSVTYSSIITNAPPPVYNWKNDNYTNDLANPLTEENYNKLLKSSHWYKAFNDWSVLMQPFLDNRQELSGIGYLLAKGIYNLLSKTRQSLIEVKTDIDVAVPRYNGYIYTVDVSALLPINIDIGIDNTKAILVNVETDYITNESTCKFFIPEL